MRDEAGRLTRAWLGHELQRRQAAADVWCASDAEPHQCQVAELQLIRLARRAEALGADQLGGVHVTGLSEADESEGLETLLEQAPAWLRP